MENEKIYWLDKWEGIAEGGYFLRNSLVEFFRKLSAKGIKPVGIKYDGSWNLEIMVDKETIPLEDKSGK